MARSRTAITELLLLTLFVVGSTFSCDFLDSSSNDAPGAAGSSPSAGGPAGNGAPPYQNVTPHAALRGESNFAKLLLQNPRAQAKAVPWAGYWWPFLQNGTADALTRYESVNGVTGAADWETANHGPGSSVLSWWGHCNGWSAAAVLYPEPKAPITRNGVTFSVGDQKALLSEIAMEVNADFFGNRVDDPNDVSSPAFLDVYPDQFFLVLTNLMPRGLPLIIDRYTGDQVWNQPLAGYEIDPITPDDSLGTDPSAPDVHRVQVTMTIWWASDSVDSNWVTEPFAFTDSDSYQHRVLRAELWLDAPPQFDASGTLVSSGNLIMAPANGVVTGGSWNNTDLPAENSHPDYIWVPYGVAAPTTFANPRLNPSQVSAFVIGS